MRNFLYKSCNVEMYEQMDGSNLLIAQERG